MDKETVSSLIELYSLLRDQQQNNLELRRAIRAMFEVWKDRPEFRQEYDKYLQAVERTVLAPHQASTLDAIDAKLQHLRKLL